MDPIVESKLSVLFDSLSNLLLKEKTIKSNEGQFTDILFKILSKSGPNQAKLFANSALFVEKTIANSLLEDGLIQVSASDGQDKYCLTFKGIAEVLRLKFNVPYEKQFSDYLNDLDRTYSAIDESDLSWRERLTTFSLLLVGACSVNSAVVLDSKSNLDVMTEVFEKVLYALQKNNLIEADAMLNTGLRGEAPILFLINRLKDLTKKTNHYYKNPGKSIHYFELEEEGHVSKQRTFFLLKKAFSNYHTGVDYKKLSDELQSISLKYSPGFANRKIMQRDIFDINGYLVEFVQDEIHRLPLGKVGKEGS